MYVKMISTNLILLDLSVDGCQTSPANYYLQILAETGTIGFLFIIAILVCFFSLALSLKKITIIIIVIIVIF